MNVQHNYRSILTLAAIFLGSALPLLCCAQEPSSKRQKSKMGDMDMGQKINTESYVFNRPAMRFDTQVVEPISITADQKPCSYVDEEKGLYAVLQLIRRPFEGESIKIGALTEQKDMFRRNGDFSQKLNAIFSKSVDIEKEITAIAHDVRKNNPLHMLAATIAHVDREERVLTAVVVNAQRSVGLKYHGVGNIEVLDIKSKNDVPAIMRKNLSNNISTFIYLVGSRFAQHMNMPGALCSHQFTGWEELEELRPSISGMDHFLQLYQKYAKISLNRAVQHLQNAGVPNSTISARTHDISFVAIHVNPELEAMRLRQEHQEWRDKGLIDGIFNTMNHDDAVRYCQTTYSLQGTDQYSLAQELMDRTRDQKKLTQEVL